MATLVPRRYRERGVAGVPAALDWMDRFFEQIAPSRLFGGRPSPWDEQSELMPAFDVSETGDHILVKADIPGIDAKGLDITVSGNLLTIRGERKEEQKGENESFHWMERRFGSFSRSFTLPADVKQDGIQAAYKDGVLTISIPKVESTFKKIEVKSVEAGLH